jgi:integrase
MSRLINRLNAAKVRTITRPGRYADGAGLWLQIDKTRRSWLFRYTFGSRPRKIGLGPIATLGLADARIEAQRLHAQLRDGIDPLVHRRATRSAQRLQQLKSITFREAAAKYIASHSAGWKNLKHANQWTQSLKAHVDAIIGTTPVQDIDTALVMRVLEPIWTTTNETAVRVRGRIEAILDWSKVNGYRTGENPARWKGHLDHLLAKPSKVQKVVHHAALPFSEIHGFVQTLRQQSGVGAAALEFTILCAARTAETIGATWDEIDLDAKRWTIPAARMKAGKAHTVPLCTRAIEILESMRALGGVYVFPAAKRPLSNAAMSSVLKRMRVATTVHGFRSTFSDWAAEKTGYQHEVREMSPAHAVSSAVEASYRRGDLFDKRVGLMNDWARYIDTKPGSTTDKVVQIRSAS